MLKWYWKMIYQQLLLVWLHCHSTPCTADGESNNSNSSVDGGQGRFTAAESEFMGLIAAMPFFYHKE